MNSSVRYLYKAFFAAEQAPKFFCGEKKNDGAAMKSRTVLFDKELLKYK